MFCSPADVYPLLLLQTDPSDPAGDGVGDIVFPFPAPLFGEVLSLGA